MENFVSTLDFETPRGGFYAVADLRGVSEWGKPSRSRRARFFRRCCVGCGTIAGFTVIAAIILRMS